MVMLARRGLPPGRKVPDTVGGVRCPACGEPSVTSNSRRAGNQVRRRRVCVSCGERFTTHERIEGEEIDLESIRGRLRSLIDEAQKCLDALVIDTENTK